MPAMEFIRQVYDTLLDFLAKSNSAFFAVAYVTTSGVNLIRNYLPQDTRIITCIDFFLTEPEALEHLVNLGVEVRVLNARPAFHPKVSYFMKNTTEAYAIIGSSNLTEAGLRDNIEANIVLRGGVNEKIFRDIQDYLEELWNHRLARDVTPRFLQWYSERWKRAKPRIQRIIERTTTRVRTRDQKYWILITSEQNYEICVREGLWGVEYAKRMIREMKPGDLVVFYIKGKKIFAGPFIVTTEVYYEDRVKIWPDKKYPWRIGIKPYRRYVEKNAEDVVKELKFIEDPKNWGAYLRGEMRQINKQVFEKLIMWHAIG